MCKKSLAVDAVFCISLVDRQDRRNLLLQEFYKCFENKVEFILVDKDIENPERGCYNSHKKCAQLILDRGYKRALILEDDATFTSIKMQQLKDINYFITKKNPDIFFLGGIVCKLWLTWKRSIALCDLVCAHAYILSSDASMRFVELDYMGEALDHFYGKLFPYKYCCIPLISDQQPDSIVGSDIEKFRGDSKSVSVLKTKEFWEKNSLEQYRQIKKNRNIKQWIWWYFINLRNKE